MKIIYKKKKEMNLHIKYENDRKTCSIEIYNMYEITCIDALFCKTHS